NKPHLIVSLAFSEFLVKGRACACLAVSNYKEVFLSIKNVSKRFRFGLENDILFFRYRTGQRHHLLSWNHPFLKTVQPNISGSQEVAFSQRVIQSNGFLLFVSDCASVCKQ